MMWIVKAFGLLALFVIALSLLGLAEVAALLAPPLFLVVLFLGFLPLARPGRLLPTGARTVRRINYLGHYRGPFGTAGEAVIVTFAVWEIGAFLERPLGVFQVVLTLGLALGALALLGEDLGELLGNIVAAPAVAMLVWRVLRLPPGEAQVSKLVFFAALVIVVVVLIGVWNLPWLPVPMFRGLEGSGPRAMVALVPPRARRNNRCPSRRRIGRTSTGRLGRISLRGRVVGRGRRSLHRRRRCCCLRAPVRVQPARDRARRSRHAAPCPWFADLWLAVWPRTFAGPTPQGSGARAPAREPAAATPVSDGGRQRAPPSPPVPPCDEQASHHLLSWRLNDRSSRSDVMRAEHEDGQHDMPPDGRGQGRDDVVHHRFAVQVLGPIAASFPGARDPGPVTRAKGVTLAGLVARGNQPLAVGSMTDLYRLNSKKGVAPSDRSQSVSLSRLRRHLPEGCIESGRRHLDLPVSSVDAWQLEALDNSSLADFTADDLLHLVTVAEPFAGVVGDVVQDDYTQVLRAAQRRLLRRLPSERPDIDLERFLPNYRFHLANDRTNERLLEAAALALERTGHRHEAIDLLSEAEADVRRSGLVVSETLNGLLVRLLSGEAEEGGSIDAVGKPAPPAGEPVSLVSRVRLPVTLSNLLDNPYVGDRRSIEVLAEQLTDGSGTTPLVVLGPPGLGKSRVCAEVAVLADDAGFDLLVLEPESTSRPFQPLANALPHFRDRLLDEDPAQWTGERQVALWAAATDSIDRHGTGSRPLLVIVDDAQELDTQTADYLLNLAMSTLRRRLVLIIAGWPPGLTQPETDRSPWSRLHGKLLPKRATAVEIGLADETALRDLVGHRRPDLSQGAILRTARELATLTGGLRGLAGLYLDLLPADVSFPNIGLGQASTILRHAVAPLDPLARQVGALGAVIGRPFTVDDIVEMLDLDEEEVAVAVDELEQAQLVEELSPAEFKIIHGLAEAALLTEAEADDRATWHAAACRLPDNDIHARAKHLAGAGSLVDPDETLAALLESAADYLRYGLHWEALDVYRLARRYQRPLKPMAEGGFARALDLVGAHDEASEVRNEAVASALANGDGDEALWIATASYPEIESLNGNPVLVANLRSIDVETLGPNALFERACHLARQLTILGQHDAAVGEARRAIELAETPQQIVEAAMATRFVRAATSRPADCIELLSAVAHHVDRLTPGVRATFEVLQLIDLYEAGRMDDARRHWNSVGRLPEPLPPIRRWHLLHFEAILAIEEGRGSDGGESARAALVDAAFEHGMLHGIGEAERAWMAAQFSHFWLTTPELLPLVELPPEDDPEESVLIRSARVVQAEEVRRAEKTDSTNEALERAEELARDIIDAPVITGVAALAVIAEVLGRSEKKHLIDGARQLLSIRSGTMLLVGAFVGSLGPVDRYLAHLAPEGPSRRHYLDRALALAQFIDSPFWIRIIERDRAIGRQDPLG